MIAHMTCIICQNIPGMLGILTDLMSRPQPQGLHQFPTVLHITKAIPICRSHSSQSLIRHVYPDSSDSFITLFSFASQCSILCFPSLISDFSFFIIPLTDYP